jgi:allantoinase
VFRPATVLVEGGRVAALAPYRPESEVGEGCALLPALTDSHVHLNEPGRTAWEGVATGTAAAAAGGVTVVVDMPLNSDPPTVSVADLERKAAAAEGQLAVDFAMWGGVVPGNEAELAGMVAAGALGFKCFLCPSGIDEFPPVDATGLRTAMRALRPLGVPLLVHAEIEDAVVVDPSVRGHAAWLDGRPQRWEEAAVALVAAMVAETGCRAHIVHLSAAGALAHVRAAKAAGLPLTAETCPHYLGLAAEDVPDGATEFKCAPPIRERANADHLWAALLDGTLDFVVTDHSPCLPSLKAGGFLDAWGGIASLQLGLRSVWTAASARGVPLERVAGWMASGPAAFSGLRRGRIEVGAPADLVAFAPDEVSVVDARRLLHRHPVSPWHGRTLRGRVATTWLRGEPVWDGVQLIGPRRGRVIRGRDSAGP